MKKKVFSLVTILISAILSFSAVACDGGREVRVITFEANGGTTVSAMTVREGESVTLPATSKEGYTFDGWYLSADFTGERLPALFTPTASVILYAKWTETVPPIVLETYVVTFEANGGATIAAMTVKEGESATLPETSKEGYTFDGWYLSADFTGERLSAAYTPTSNVILYAKWIAETPPTTLFILTYEVNGGQTLAASGIYAGVGFSLPTPTKDGCTFDGWYLSADLTGEKLPTFYTPVASVILYAKWKPAAYIITFECNGGMAVPAAAVTAGGAVTLPETTKEGFAFIGWYKNPSFSGEMCRAPYIPASSEILYAKWAVTVFSVTFDLNYNGSVSFTQHVEYGSKPIRPDNPTRDNYAFLGWFPAAAGGNDFNFDSAIYADTTVYALWEEAYAITLNYNYDGVPENDIIYVPKSNHNVGLYRPEDPTRDGYGFIGWYTEADGTEEFLFWHRVTADTTIYAAWNLQLVMEAEYADLTEKHGPGYSGSATGTEMICSDDGGSRNASNGFFVGFLYSNAQNTTLEFEFVSALPTSDAKIIVRMSAEYFTQTFSDANYTVSLNGIPLTGWMSPEFVGSENPEFTDVVIAVGESLNAGENIITLSTTNYLSPGGTIQSSAPLIDCVKITSASTLSWQPHTGNFDADGFPLT